MTICNTQEASEYFGILSNGHASGRLTYIAETTEKAVEAMLEVFSAAGLKFPNDDRCANIELSIYQIAKSVNGQHTS